MEARMAASGILDCIGNPVAIGSLTFTRAATTPAQIKQSTEDEGYVNATGIPASDTCCPG